MNSNKEAYRNLCQSENVPVFLSYWWLDIVCDKKWDVVVVGNGTEIQAAMPFSVSSKFGLTFVNMPKLTGFLGPWIKYPKGQKYESRLSFEMDMLRKLVEQLPPFDLFRQRFHYSMTNWLPFYWAGFEQMTRYTYVVDLGDLDVVFHEFRSSVRTKIRKATEAVTVTHKRSIDEFYKMLLLTFHRQKLNAPVSLEFIRKMDDALVSRNQRRIFFATDKEGKIHSALYLIWDKLSAYVHMVGEDPELRNSGAGSLLIWEAMKFTKNELKLTQFDFLGSMIESVETVRRSFGGRQVPYFQIKKVNSRLLRTAMFFGVIKN